MMIKGVYRSYGGASGVSCGKCYSDRIGYVRRCGRCGYFPLRKSHIVIIVIALLLVAGVFMDALVMNVIPGRSAK